MYASDQSEGGTAMKALWKRKWIVIPVAAAIVLAAGAVGAVALASPGDNSAAAAATELVTATTQTAGDTTAPALDQVAKRKAKVQERLDRVKKRWAEARAKMTPEDAALFDQLKGKSQDQREALQQARKDLGGTLKQMRELVQKYKPATTTTTVPAT
jgi:uncharacterized protein involved in exopolysaccharide biosynthesis